MVIQQAMAAGLPVVATRVGGTPFMIEHEVTGLLFEPGEIAVLERQLERIALDAQLAQRLSGSARLRALASFTPEGVAKATRAAYVRILPPHSGSHSSKKDAQLDPENAALSSS